MLLIGALSLFFSLTASAETYLCKTEFGETVPLKIRTADKEVLLNESARKIKQRSKVKTKQFGQKDFQMETRYLKQNGPQFEITVNCSKKPCDGFLTFEKRKYNLREPLSLAPLSELFDKRGGAKGSITVMLSQRKHLGLIVRVFKSAHGSVPPSSSSGEFKWTQWPIELIVHDVGTDEQVFYQEKHLGRIATFEVKIRCQILR